MILGLGISFELPILIFFLAMFGSRQSQVPVEEHPLRGAGSLPGGGRDLSKSRSVDDVHLCCADAGALLHRHPRRLVGAPVAPESERGSGNVRRTSSVSAMAEESWVPQVSILRPGNQSALISSCALLALSLAPFTASAQHFNGAKALDYTREFVSIGPRWPTSPNHGKAEAYLRSHLEHDQLEEDTFIANTPIGPVNMRNFIVRFPGKKDGVIVLATHYETNYFLKNINFVGANDGGATTGLLLALGDHFREQIARTKQLDGYSVWLVFFDGEEAIQSWSQSDSTYGSRHLAAKWGRDGTLKRIKAFMLADMIGDKDLDIQRETQLD